MEVEWVEDVVEQPAPEGALLRSQASSGMFETSGTCFTRTMQFTIPTLAWTP